MFRVRYNLDLDYLVRRSRFLLLVVLLQQLAHLFRTRRFFIGGGRFGIRRVRLLVCFGSGMSGRDIARRACRLGMLRRSERNILFGRTLYG